jgi:hypothetical protein
MNRASSYLLTDLFLAFWFRYVQPTEAALEQGADDWVMQQRILPDLDAFVSRPHGPWERACQQFLWRAFRRGLLDETGFDRLGWWWEGRGANRHSELDAVGMNGRRITLVASCEWRNEFTKPGDLNELRRVAHRAGPDDDTRYVMFSRSGFDPSLIEIARLEDVRLVSPEQMYDERLLG